MKKLSLNIRLLIVFVLILCGTIAVQKFLIVKNSVDNTGTMRKAIALTESWFSVVKDLKTEKGITEYVHSNVPYYYMIGDEWSDITTTLGSLEAKEISSNPDFSALIVRLLKEAGIKKGDYVGMIISGSFPSLAISTLAALQTTGAEVILMSSLGSSTYGANQPDVTWIDIESGLISDGGMKYHSSLVTIGANGDSGDGLSGEGIAHIYEAAERNHIELYVPEDLPESIKKKEEIFSEAHISLLINIGGNQTALGACPHSTTIPNGLVMDYKGCSDINRGLITRMSENNIPFINLLDIKSLAGRYGIDVSPGIRYSESTNLYTHNHTRKGLLAIILLVELFPLVFLKRNNLN